MITSTQSLEILVLQGWSWIMSHKSTQELLEPCKFLPINALILVFLWCIDMCSLPSCDEEGTLLLNILSVESLLKRLTSSALEL